MNISKKVLTTAYTDVKIINFAGWNETLENPRLHALPCSACGGKLGKRRWAIAWAKDDKREFSLRLCEPCGVKAEQEFGFEP